MKRKQAEEITIAAIYDVLLYTEMGKTIDLEELISSLCETSYESADAFVKRMVIAAIKHMKEIIPAYEEHMRGWTWNRLDHLEQALLLYCYCHFFYDTEEVSKKIVINVGVEYAKTYLDPKAKGFINAILDKVLVKNA